MPIQTPGKKIRVMVVDDSIVARNFIIGGLSAHPQIEVVGYATNAAQAREKLDDLKPDVMTLDVEMPGISGIEFLKKLLPERPLPVILVSSLNLRVFEALAAGAVDFVRKPDASVPRETFFTSLSQKVITASFAHVRAPRPAPPAVAPAATSSAALVSPPLGAGSALDNVIIGLGASTGGTEATLEVVKRLPADLPPMIIVQHMPAGFTKMYAERLDRLCQMQVKEAENGDVLRRGLMLVAPAELQCRVQRRADGKYCVQCAPGEKVSGHRPSVDALFFSMAENIRCKTVGIIMTGMGRDGADGLLAMRKNGAYTIGQDKESSVVYGMPMVANDIGAVQIQSSCENIASLLLRHLKSL